MFAVVTIFKDEDEQGETSWSTYDIQEEASLVFESKKEENPSAEILLCEVISYENTLG